VDKLAAGDDLQLPPRNDRIPVVTGDAIEVCLPVEILESGCQPDANIALTVRLCAADLVGALL